MIHYVYDGSFPGLMTAIQTAIEKNEFPDSIQPDNTFERQRDLFSYPIFIQNDTDRVEFIINRILKEISREALSNIIHAYLSDNPGAGRLVLHYLKKGFLQGKTIDRHLSDASILQLFNLIKKVKFERHRVLGLLRFQEIEQGLLYAAFKPDHNITGLVAPHFKQRLANKEFIIHDLTRNIAAIYKNKTLVIACIELEHIPVITEKESYFQKIWQQYHHNISIKERSNPKLQGQFIPSRYWEFLIERKS